MERELRYESLTIRIVKEIKATDIAPVIDEVSQDFYGIELQRETFRTGAGGPGMTEAAIALIVGATAAGFLAELGKDIYQTFGQLLWSLYTKWKKEVTPTGSFEPFSVIVGRTGAGVYFIYEMGLNQDEFLAALASMHTAAVQVTDLPPEDSFPWWIEFRFDPKSGSWRRVHDEVGGILS